MSHRPGKVLLLHNPKSGASDAREVVDAHVALLQQHHFQMEVIDSLDAFQSLASRFTAEGSLRAVIAAGGDGTASAVASRITSSTPLWLCPLGTENLLARYLGMTGSPQQAVRAIQANQTRQLDAGLANDKLFLVMASVGYDAEVVRIVHSQRRGHLQRWHYFWPMLRTMVRYGFPELTITPQDLEAFSAAWCFCMNVPRYADGLAIAPMACDHDGAIDICAFRRGGVLRGFSYLYHLRRQTHVGLVDFLHRRTHALQIESPTSLHPVPYQLDGDFGGYLPLKITMQPQRIRIIVPQSGPIERASGSTSNSNPKGT